MSHLRFYLPFAVVLLLLSEPLEGPKILGALPNFFLILLMFSFLCLHRFGGGGMTPSASGTPGCALVDTEPRRCRWRHGGC